MKWMDFKRIVEEQGLKDDDELTNVDWVDGMKPVVDESTRGKSISEAYFLPEEEDETKNEI